MTQTNTLQLVPNARLLAANAALAHARLVAAVRRERLLGHGQNAIARRHGVGNGTVLECVEEEAVERAAKSWSDGYRAGYNAARFHPLPPSVAQRRAA